MDANWKCGHCGGPAETQNSYCNYCGSFFMIPNIKEEPQRNGYLAAALDLLIIGVGSFVIVGVFYLVLS